VPELFKNYIAEVLEESDFPFEIRTIPPLTQKALALLKDDRMPKRVKSFLKEIIEDADVKRRRAKG
jgi:hypothetical protein